MKVLFVENAGILSAGAFHSMVVLIKCLRQYEVESYVAIPKGVNGINILIENKIPFIEMKSCSYSWMIKNDAPLLEKIKMPLKFVYTYFESFKLAKYCEKQGIQIIHENTSACYIGKFVSDLLHIKHVWHIREFMEEDFDARIWCRNTAIKYFNSSDAVITVSRAIYDKYSSEIDNKKMHLIYNGIPILKFYKENHEIFKSETIKILSVGRICKGKGQDILIKAAGLLKREYGIEVSIYLAGSYNDENLKKIVNLSKENDVYDKVQILGQYNKIEELYQKCDVFCMTSLCEGFGKVTIEAMLSGMLVIGSDSGGTSEIIEDNYNGLLFNPGDSEMLKDKIYYTLLNRTEMKRVALKGQQIAKEKYDAFRNAKEIYDLYKELI